MEPVKYLWPVLKHTKSAIKNFGKKKFVTSSHILRKYSTESANAEELVVQDKIHLSKPSVTKWKRPPFLKNFFIGKFDTELLSFPEILDKEQVAELESTVKHLNEIMKQKVNSFEIDKTGQIPESLLQDLKDMGLFGRMIPSKYGGMDLSYSACVRLNEVLGLDWSLFSTIAAHEFLAAQVILKFGSEAQKARYLPRMASGELIAAFCCSERQSGSDLSSMTTKLEKISEDTYCINGTKSWVTNADRADVFIVFTKSENPVDPNLSSISAFIVDKDPETIKITKQNKNCLNGLEIGTVSFQNAVVPSSNVIKGIGEGVPIYLKAIESFMIMSNSYTFGTLKALFDAITERIIHTEKNGESMADKQLIRRRLSNINSMIYAMESVSYFTAALLDSTENPDVEIESAALKLFNSRGTLFCIREMMELLGSSSLTGDMQLDRFYKDAQGLVYFDMPNDITKLLISMNGLRFSGMNSDKAVLELRNPYYFPLRTVKGYFRRLKVSKGFFKYDQDIAGHIHPSLVAFGNQLEEKIQLFEVCVENMLTAHGNKIVLTQLDPRTLAEAAADIYAFSAVLSRVSRSYCLGMKNCHHEIILAMSFCFEINERIMKNIGHLMLGINENNEGNRMLIGEQVIDCSGYFAEHPLAHNF